MPVFRSYRSPATDSVVGATGERASPVPSTNKASRSGVGATLTNAGETRAEMHVTAELIRSIFDVDKLLYFVAPEWWLPRRRRCQASPQPDNLSLR